MSPLRTTYLGFCTFGLGTLVVAIGCSAGAPTPAQDNAMVETDAGNPYVIQGSGGCVPSVEFTCGTGGSVATGGTTGNTGGTVSAGTGGAPEPFSFPGSTINLCPDANVVSLPLESFSECDMVGCTAAHCVPKTAIPASVDQSLLAPCDTDTVCVPDDYTLTYGSFLAKTCTSLEGAEGRCISTCIPKVNGLMDVLPQADCGDNERCAPCYNPNDGTPTGACIQGCDTGPDPATTADPIVFDKCGGGAGVCAPKAIVPTVLLGELPQDQCPADYVCAPEQKTQNLKYNFPACSPDNGFVLLLEQLGQTMPKGQLGGCVPQYLADANPIQGIFLTQGTCQTGEKCAPCFNPLRGNAPTGACPVPLPSDPTGGLPPEGGLSTGTGGTGGSGGTSATGGTGGTAP